MREKILFDENWMFHDGEITENQPKDKGPIYKQAKTERKLSGPASVRYKGAVDSFMPEYIQCTDKWEWVNLPHDYIITQEPKKDNNSCLGYFDYHSAWYRKTFKLSTDDTDKRITLLFDGIATHSTIYLNGCLMKHNFCGYNSFEVDITDVVKYGEEENVLAVYVQPGDFEGWWYQGGGIYRHVWLIKTDTVAVDLWGVYAAPKKLSEIQWEVKMETTVRNDRYEDVTANIESIILNREGEEICRVSSQLVIPYREKSTAVYFAKVENPILWDIDNPYQYTIETQISAEGKICDTYSVKTGFRTFVLDPDEGLFLNGKHTKIKGVCAHQDFGLTGKAVADNVHRYKIEMLKEMGANGYRTSHYPQTEAIMDALDDLGFIVMAETRWFESTDEGKQQLEMLIKRDRNRPSVLFWSVGNEEPHHLTEEGRRICKSLKAFIQKLDDTRYIMSAVSHDPDVATVYDELDAIGINYNLDKFDKIHEKYPHKPVFSSECCATGTTRGWYDEDFPEKSRLSAYDKDTNKWFLGREKTWKFMCDRKWVLGEYQWIAFEHRGETLWPRLCSVSGAIDLYLQKKDAFYQNQSHWIEDKPIVHLMPHWNFRGREGELIKVVAYTNCSEVELYLNGKSLGKQQIEKYGHGEWIVDYAPGELSVQARNNGVTVATDTKVTTGKATALRLIPENKITQANGTDVAIITCICTDEKGAEVPDSTPFVSFNTNGLGKIIGTGSDNTDHNPVNLTERKMYAGRISIAVQVGKTPGVLKVYANSEHLDSAVISIPLS